MKLISTNNNDVVIKHSHKVVTMGHRRYRNKICDNNKKLGYKLEMFYIFRIMSFLFESILPFVQVYIYDPE